MSDLFNVFLVGAVAMGHWVAGLFFLRFWTKTHDRLFAMFAAAFWQLGVNRVVMLITRDYEENHYAYWVRLGAYLVILVAIIDKNRSRDTRGDSE